MPDTHHTSPKLQKILRRLHDLMQQQVGTTANWNAVARSCTYSYLGHCAGQLQGTGLPLAAMAASCLLAASTASGHSPLLVTVPFRRNGRRYRL